MLNNMYLLVASSNKAERDAIGTRTLSTKDRIDPKYKWNLAKIYATTDDWKKDFDYILDNLKIFEDYKHNLYTPERVIEYLKDKNVKNLIERFNLCYNYAKFKYCEDYTVIENQDIIAHAETLNIKFSSACSFIDDEILKNDKELLKTKISEYSELKEYGHYIENLYKQKDNGHVVPSVIENIINEANKILFTSNRIYNAINEEIEFGYITDKNNAKTKLTRTNYALFVKSNNREIRKAAFVKYTHAWLKLQHTLAINYASKLEAVEFLSKIYGYNSALEMSLHRDNIPVKLYFDLINTVHKNLPVYEEFLLLKCKKLGLTRLHQYDLSASMFKDVNKQFTYVEAKEIILKALLPLGKDYVNKVKEMMSNNWIDVYDSPGKFSLEFTGSFKNKNFHPLVSIKFTGTVCDIFTLIHEIGHAMHFYYTERNQPLIYNEPTIFCDEIASSVNEYLLTNYFLKNKKDDEDFKKYLIEMVLMNFLQVIVYQTLFAEFEMRAHEMHKNGKAINADSLNNLYYNLSKKYYGPKALFYDDEIKINWATIPHFYSPFYVYTYVTGQISAIAILKKILNGDNSILEKYITFLKSGCSDYPMNLLKKIGVDMSTSKPIQDSFDYFKIIFDKLAS